MITPHRYETAKRATIINAGTNTLLSIVKIVTGWFSHSHALIADGVHSLSDLITDALVLIAAKIGGRIPDKEHPYGHQRIETIAAMIIAVLLWVVGGAILYNTYQHFIHTTPSQLNGTPVIIIAVLSMIAKELLYRYTLKMGQKVHSNLLITNAYHNRSDVYVSGLVLISVIAHLLGLKYADPISAGLIALIIVKSGFQLFLQGLREVIDTGVDPEILSKIKKCIESIPGIVSIHQLRTRFHGGNIFVDTHLIVNPFISVSEGHHIGEKVHWQLTQVFTQIVDVVVHIDPENDEERKPSLHLPSRPEIILLLNKYWINLPGFKKIESIRLHYFNGQIYIEVYWLANAISMDQWLVMKRVYSETAKSIPDLAAVTLFMRL